MNERILKVIDYLDISISEFERSCNLSNGAVSKMGDNTRRSTLNKICDTYPQLNIDWLLTGKGDMVKEYTVASLRDRILEYCDFKKMTINEFQAKAGLDKYLFDDSSKAINSHIIKKILYYHPDLNREWLLTGEGEMLKGGKSDNTVSISGNDIKEGDFSGTLVYDIDATCGTDCRDILFAKDDIIGSINLPGIRKDSVIIRANGDSMEPRVCDGNLVVIRQIYSWDDIFYGQIYMILLDEYRMIKYIRKCQEDEANYIILHSENPAYDDIKLHKSKIRKLFIVENILAIRAQL